MSFRGMGHQIIQRVLVWLSLHARFGPSAAAVAHAVPEFDRQTRALVSRPTVALPDRVRSGQATSAVTACVLMLGPECGQAPSGQWKLQPSARSGARLARRLVRLVRTGCRAQGDASRKRGRPLSPAVTVWQVTDWQAATAD